VTVVVNSNAESNTWSNFLDLQADVKPWLQMEPANQSQDPQLQLIVDMACQWVQNWIGRPIAPTSFDRRFDGWAGWNGAYIELPYYPVLEITSVTEYWGASGPHVLSEQTPTNQIDGWQCDYMRGMLTRVFPGLVQKPWFPGSRNIEVVWTAGYNPLPADIKLATLEFVAYWWRNTQQASRPSLRVGGEYDSPALAGLWAGVPGRIEELLEPYIQVGMA
jgi:hypothetical protein